MAIITVLLLTVIMLLIIWVAIILTILARQRNFSYILESLDTNSAHSALMTNIRDIEALLNDVQKSAETDKERIEYLRITARIIRDREP
jgi:predicted Holliday junction resolvase-like endonuclease